MGAQRWRSAPRPEINTRVGPVPTRSYESLIRPVVTEGMFQLLERKVTGEGVCDLDKVGIHWVQSISLTGKGAKFSIAIYPHAASYADKAKGIKLR